MITRYKVRFPDFYVSKSEDGEYVKLADVARIFNESKKIPFDGSLSSMGSLYSDEMEAQENYVLNELFGKTTYASEL